ncbi:MAG TPA: class I SAM-dependent methyltransferase [Candidatus Acidoferrum sp.]|nr:class I SAM-dependent methyltransferase [Candidatus Acidoferrum sp.]
MTDLSPLPESFAEALYSLYNLEPQLGSDGQLHPIDETTRISAEAGLNLYEICKSRNAQTSLEIGMAYGFSTLYFLAAGCSHTAIDPFERSRWHGIALTAVQKLGKPVEFIEDNSFTALAGLAAAKRQFDVILIDGNHRFDDVLVDFTLAALLSKVGSIILLDDLWMPSISLVREFILKNRSDFAAVESSSRFAAFQMLHHDDRPWDHFTDFSPPPAAKQLLKQLFRKVSHKVAARSVV